MNRHIGLITVMSLLASCSGLNPLKTYFDIGDKQTQSSTSTNNGNGFGRDAKLDFNLNADENKSKQYSDSNIRSEDSNTDNQIETTQDTTKFSVGGEHTDKSMKSQHTITQTKSDTDDDNYVGKSISINNTDNVTLVIVFVSCIFLMIFFVIWTLFVYRLRRRRAMSSEKI